MSEMVSPGWSESELSFEHAELEFTRQWCTLFRERSEPGGWGVMSFLAVALSPSLGEDKEESLPSEESPPSNGILPFFPLFCLLFILCASSFAAEHQPSRGLWLQCSVCCSPSLPF